MAIPKQPRCSAKDGSARAGSHLITAQMVGSGSVLHCGMSADTEYWIARSDNLSGRCCCALLVHVPTWTADPSPVASSLAGHVLVAARSLSAEALAYYAKKCSAHESTRATASVGTTLGQQ